MDTLTQPERARASRLSRATRRRYDQPMRNRRVQLAAPIGVILLLSPGGCKRQPQDSTTSPAAPVSSRNEGALIFPTAMRVADGEVNEFVDQAMRLCAAGDYEPFRRLWSVHEEPISKSEFTSAWESVAEIRLLALEKVRIKSTQPASSGSPSADAPPSTFDAGAIGDPSDPAAQPNVSVVDGYALMAAVVQLEDDPQAPDPATPGRHEVVLVLTRENEGWKLARAPKPIRTWIKQKVQSVSGAAESPATASPPTSGG